MRRLSLSCLALACCTVGAVAAGPGEMPFTPHPGEGIGHFGFLGFVAVIGLTFLAIYM